MDVQRFADEGFAVLYAPSMRNGEGDARDEHGAAEDRGNAIVSTLPLEDPRVIELPLERQRRVAAAATVAGQSVRSRWQLEIVDVHLDTSLALFHGGPFAAAAARRARCSMRCAPSASLRTEPERRWSVAISTRGTAAMNRP
jgi:hypothetical protein